MSLRDRYYALDTPCRKQCRALFKILDRDPKLLSAMKEFKPSGEKDRKYAGCLAIKAMSLLDLLNNKRLYKALYCYNTKPGAPYGNFQFIDQITSDDHVCLISGFITFKDVKVPMVMKYYRSPKRTIDYEIGCYKMIAEAGCEIPWMSGSYQLLGERVMIMERLYSIDESDKPEAIGIDVLKQLKLAHKLGVHNDLKPPNIMVRRRDHEVYVGERKDAFKYLIIDWGGMAREKLGAGYRRFIWNPKFTSQTKGEKNQVTGPFYDFLELGYTMGYLDGTRRGKKRFDHRKEFTGKFKRYMDEVRKYESDPFNFPEDLYERLVSILEA